MALDFLGIGVAFPPAPDAGGALAGAANEDAVRQSIWIILGTAKGERAMRPDFGCGIHDLVFELNNATTAGRVAREVRDALERYEPRIEVGEIAVSAESGGSVLAISINYRIRATDTAANLVYPFYLDRSAVP